ncbi:MAG: DinB family protein [Dehalococcoidia bacterium]|nr:DinB family protein [Dehalococcoidia bacterium]
MFTGIEAFLKYFEGAHRRSLRDIAALPPEAADYRPPAGEGENAWSIGEIVLHMAGARLYFTRAYRGEGWLFDGPVRPISGQADWAPCLEDAMAEFRRRLEGTPPEWLSRRIPMIDTEGTLAGWRILMMCLEHEVHHRSQIDTYAGLQGWSPPQIYGRSAEQVGLERERQRRLHTP